MKESLVAIYTIYDNKNGPETRVSGPEIGCGAGFEPTTFRAWTWQDAQSNIRIYFPDNSWQI